MGTIAFIMAGLVLMAGFLALLRFMSRSKKVDHIADKLAKTLF